MDLCPILGLVLSITTMVVARVFPLSNTHGHNSSTHGNGGTCPFPRMLDADPGALAMYVPGRLYFIPRASQSFYSTVYRFKNGGRSAKSLEELAALRPRAQLFTLRVLSRGGNLEVSFDGDPDTWYGYRCLPSALRLAAMVANPLTPFLSLTCKYIGGSGNVLAISKVGSIHMALLWSDETAGNIWGCFEGQQNWHIVSTEPELSAEQVAANDAMLRGHELNVTDAMDMDYT